ncbi:MAG TPA: methionyl-tRNA formyltransferase [Burkholderiales bacterium]|nr:methionyl-tRNA formyltransferase [Burkholderiales bacterium]
MRVLFAGTPAFAVPALESLIEAGHRIELVLTQPDRPAGRGLAMVPSAVKQAAVRHEIPVYQPASLKDPAAQARLREAQGDLLVVASYGLILPQGVLDIAPRGALNIHASLLPRWRGAAPIQRALLAGDPTTGICIMQMDAGLDTGPVLLREAIAIAPDETAGTLHDKLASLGARLIVAVLDGLGRGALQAVPQPAEGVTYAHKIDKAEAAVDWSRSAPEIDRQVRAFNPSPGAAARLRGDPVKLWRASVLEGSGAPPGTVLRVGRKGIDVACGTGAVRLTELQRAGGKRLPVDAFLRGCAVAVGDRFD